MFQTIHSEGMTVAQEVRDYLKNKPYLLEALEKGIVNLSELSRQIRKELRTDNVIAVKAALRRFSEEQRKHRRKREEKVLQLLKKSRIAVYDGKSVVITDKQLEKENEMKVNLAGKFVYLMEKNSLAEISDAWRVHENCTMIVIHSPEELEATPGVVAFLTALLAEQGINIIEFISCWTETIIVVEKKDGLRAYEIISNVIG